MTWSEWHDTRIPSWCSSEAKSWPLALRWRCSPSDPAIEEHGVEVPDYVKITRALGGPIAITEEPAIRMAKEALS